MERFVEEADRGQRTSLPECLDNFIDKSSPSCELRVCRYARSDQDELHGSRAGGDWSTVVHASVLPKLSLGRVGGLGL